MDCPKCGGEMWFNPPEKKTNPRSPDYKCKDKDGCGHGVWLKPKGGGGKPGPAAPRGPKWTWPTLSVTYERCLKLAKKHVLAEQPKALPGDVIAACATLFIAASRDGVADIAPKAAPKPAAKEVAGETFDDFPEAHEAEDDLPY